ncbi:hypothetical protein I118_1185 [Bifidobacterium longum D2957]|nr:hypothetical protein I118_1185 [Bifidobacterium longum D2957]
MRAVRRTPRTKTKKRRQRKGKREKEQKRKTRYDTIPSAIGKEKRQDTDTQEHTRRTSHHKTASHQGEGPFSLAKKPGFGMVSMPGRRDFPFMRDAYPIRKGRWKGKAYDHRQFRRHDGRAGRPAVASDRGRGEPDPWHGRAAAARPAGIILAGLGAALLASARRGHAVAARPGRLAVGARACGAAGVRRVRLRVGHDVRVHAGEARGRAPGGLVRAGVGLVRAHGPVGCARMDAGPAGA